MASMLARLARLLLFVAVLLAPLSMTAAPAAPMQHGSGADMPKQHCPDQPASTAEKGIATCAMACAAALPAASPMPPGRTVAARHVRIPYAAATLGNRILEIATPPPKAS